MFLTPFLIFAFATSRAMPPVTLEQLVDEYRRFELPTPPAGTKCVIIESGYDKDQRDEGDTIKIIRRFALLAKPKTHSNPETEVYSGVGTFREPVFYRIHEVPAEPESLRLITGEVLHLDIITAIQCQKLGYKRLASDIYQRWKPLGRLSPRDYLWSEAGSYWLDQILNPIRDRKTIIRQLKNVHQVTPSDEIIEFIRCLELADAPRTVKDDSLEKLVDDLVDATNAISDDDFEKFHECPPIRKLIERGFDAVPVLISHLDDKRLTRCADTSGYGNPINGIPRVGVKVGNVCEYILQEMAGKLFPRVEMTELKKREWDKVSRFPFGFMPFGKEKMLQRESVDEWWKQARAKGEKEYLKSQMYMSVLPSGSVSDVNQQAVNDLPPHL